MKMLLRSDFNYEYPEELVAQEPIAERDRSRLLVSRPDSLIDSVIAELPDHLPEGSLVLVNNTKVFPSRLFGYLPSGGKVEIFLLQQLSNDVSKCRWKILARPFRKLKVGTEIALPPAFAAIITALQPDSENSVQPTAEIEFNCSSDQLIAWLQQYGYIPLPPYISRKNPKPAAESSDTERYQTVYAAHQGSVAAPTAGLHLTEELLSRLKKRGIAIKPVTLHVGGGTFLPVKTESLADHLMHEEMFNVSSDTFESWKKAKAEGRFVAAVGTTTLRCMESFLQGNIEPDQWQATKLFVYPKSRSDRYRPVSCDALLTNFHQPESTLLMLIASLIGFDRMQLCYQHAIAQRYRLFSYGDASLLFFE